MFDLRRGLMGTPMGSSYGVQLNGTGMSGNDIKQASTGLSGQEGMPGMVGGGGVTGGMQDLYGGSNVTGGGDVNGGRMRGMFGGLSNMFGALGGR